MCRVSLRFRYTPAVQFTRLADGKSFTYREKTKQKKIKLFFFVCVCLVMILISVAGETGRERIPYMVEG